MAKWEVCTIDLRSERKRTGLFGKTVDINRYVSVVDSLEGPKIVEESASWEYIVGDDSKKTYSYNTQQYEFGTVERSKLIAKLLAAGWEPVSGNMFRRELH
ncbi:MAG: hypothetical protein BroJett039_01060 [Chloroflexota bacterium]|nr:MAG: hypothetical protein BroJett039_01060 [Chloroflexota bacterium]